MTVPLAPDNTTGKAPGYGLALARLEAWLETVRDAGGYAGPVAHWWQQSLLYCGPGLDWRYQGIIEGYLSLWRGTGENSWLAKACRAGDDLRVRQLDNGHYPASAFEINPASGGTPHEAACDGALLQLALTLRQSGQPGWEVYQAAAERNLKSYYTGMLWDASAKSFRDNPTQASFVPNKAATVCEALFGLAELTGQAEWVERYALPNLDRIIEHQAGPEQGRLAGAVAQNSFGEKRIEKYFPVYNARCVPALLLGYRWSGQERYLEAARRVLQFITAWVYPDGSLPTVVYPNGSVNRYPGWIAALADVLLAARLLGSYGVGANLTATEAYLLAGQDASGAFQTGRGFQAQSAWRNKKSLPAWPDLRDVLHVTGWCDKVFRYLAARFEGETLPVAASLPFEVECIFQGRRWRLVETPQALQIFGSDKKLAYLWRKGQGQKWAETENSRFWLR